LTSSSVLGSFSTCSFFTTFSCRVSTGSSANFCCPARLGNVTGRGIVNSSMSGPNLPLLIRTWSGARRDVNTAASTSARAAFSFSSCRATIFALYCVRATSSSPCSQAGPSRRYFHMVSVPALTLEKRISCSTSILSCCILITSSASAFAKLTTWQNYQRRQDKSARARKTDSACTEDRRTLVYLPPN
jgi:hypothetical protein